MSKRRYRGQSLVEFALIIPLVLLLLLGFLDLGRAVFYYSALSNGVREATRAGIVNHNYLQDASTGADLSKAVMTSVPICPVIADQVAAKTEDTLRCIVYRYGFGLSGSLDPVNDITVNPVKDAKDLFEQIQVTANYCFVPITPGLKLLINTTCGGESAITLTAQSTMYVTPKGK